MGTLYFGCFVSHVGGAPPDTVLAHRAVIQWSVGALDTATEYSAHEWT